MLTLWNSFSRLGKVLGNLKRWDEHFVSLFNENHMALFCGNFLIKALLI